MDAKGNTDNAALAAIALEKETVICEGGVFGVGGKNLEWGLHRGNVDASYT